MSENHETDPPRLSESSDSMRAFLGAMRADIPSTAEVEALATRTAHTRVVRARLKWTAAGGAALALLAASYMALPFPTTTPRAPSPSAPDIAVPTLIVEATPTTPVSSPAMEASARAVEARARPQHVAAQGRRTQHIEPIVEVMEASPSFVEEPAPTVVESAPALDEIALLAAARRALRRDPTQTISLVREHAARFPNSAFSEERAVLRIDGLFATGDVDAARLERARFAERWPQSVHRRHLSELFAP